MQIEGGSSSDNPENLFDGYDTTLFHLENATSASLIFTLQEPWYIAGVNFDGQIAWHITYFYGVCGNCCKKAEA